MLSSTLSALLSLGRTLVRRGPHDPLCEQGRHSPHCCARRPGRCGLEGGHAQPRQGGLVGAQQLRLQPAAFVAQRLICGSIFPKPVRGTIRRKVPHQSKVSAPDFGIAGTLVHAENGKWITHQNGILGAVAPFASQSSRSTGSGIVRPSGSERNSLTMCTTAPSLPNSLTRRRSLSPDRPAISSIIDSNSSSISPLSKLSGIAAA